MSQDKTDNGKLFEYFLNMRTSSGGHEGQGHSAVFDTATRGHYELTELLLGKYHADYDMYDKQGSSPLHAESLWKNMLLAELYLGWAHERRGVNGRRFEAFLH